MTKSYADILYAEMSKVRSLTKYGEIYNDKHIKMSRPMRIMLLDNATTAYAIAHDTTFEHEREYAYDNGTQFPYRPHNERLLEMAANLVLYEELSNKIGNKSALEEYAFLSDEQMARRKTGAHERNTGVSKGEAPFSMAATIGSDGRNYKQPKRRKRSDFENVNFDLEAKIRNKERRKAYNDFIKPTPVITYKKSEGYSWE